MVQLDNVKMWESILGRLNNCEDTVYKTFIIDSLKDQGFTYENDKIIELPIEKGKWYVCIKDLYDDYSNVAFKKGNLYQGMALNLMMPENSNVPYNLTVPKYYFRPATEEEIKQHLFVEEEIKGNNGGISSKFKVGDTVRAKTIKNFMFTIKDITDKHYIDSNGGKYDIEGQDYLELVEPKQESSDGELTEFEKAVGVSIGSWNPNKEGKKRVKAVANKLLSVARKQIASEIDVDYMVIPRNLCYHQNTSIYRQGIEDVLKKIIEG